MRIQLLIPVMLCAFAIGIGMITASFSTSTLIWSTIAVVIFAVSFVQVEWGLYILIFSMLLSPEISLGGSGSGRDVTVRFEDFLLIVIGLGWLARNAVHKELGLLLRTPLNRAIFLYITACFLATGFGIMAGRVAPLNGFFFWLKYVEYFVIFFMLVNHANQPDQIHRLAVCLFLTCAIVSVVGIYQIPSGGRVSAPFEGEIGEPNTFGGYLVLLGAMAGGLAMRLRPGPPKYLLVGMLVLAVVPLVYTQSRASYLAALPAMFVLFWMTRRRAITVGVFVFFLVASPFLMPQVVQKRLAYTVSQSYHQKQIAVGGVRLDTSTSARLISWQEAFKDWTTHPLFGFGITGYKLVDAQLPRVLVETGVVGLATFVYLLWAIARMAIHHLRMVQSPVFVGLCIGYLAGFVGLIFHAIGANTFIIVRIMEPFWFFTGIIAILPAMESAGRDGLDLSSARGDARLDRQLSQAKQF